MSITGALNSFEILGRKGPAAKSDCDGLETHETSWPKSRMTVSGTQRYDGTFIAIDNAGVGT